MIVCLVNQTDIFLLSKILVAIKIEVFLFVEFFHFVFSISNIIQLIRKGSEGGNESIVPGRKIPRKNFEPCGYLCPGEIHSLGAIELGQGGHWNLGPSSF